MLTITISQFERSGIAYRSALIMADRCISGDVIPGFSSVGGRVENRAEIRIYEDVTGHHLRLLWTDLKVDSGLTCAWIVDPETGYEGCILKHPTFVDAEIASPVPSTITADRHNKGYPQ